MHAPVVMLLLNPPIYKIAEGNLVDARAGCDAVVESPIYKIAAGNLVDGELKPEA